MQNPNIDKFQSEALFAMWSEKQKELSRIQQSENMNNKLLSQQIDQIQNRIYFIEKILLNRLTEENVSIREIAKRLLTASGIKRAFYQEAFTVKLLKRDSLIDLKLLKQGLDQLTLHQLLRIATMPDMEIAHSIIEKGIQESSQDLITALNNSDIETVWGLVTNCDNWTIINTAANECLNQKIFEVESDLLQDLEEKSQRDKEEADALRKHKRK